MEDETTPEVNLKVIIPLRAYQQIIAYTKIVETEISGMANCEFNEKKGAFVLGKVFLLNQKAGGADVEIDEEALSNLCTSLIKKGVKQLPRCWWHSHADFGVFFSGIDENTMPEARNGSFTLFLVVNQKEEMEASVMLWKPIVLRIDKLPVEIDYGFKGIPKRFVDEVKQKVRNQKTLFESKQSEKVTKYNFGKKKKGDGSRGVIMVLTLPKNRAMARQVIALNDCQSTYDSFFEEVVWESKDGKKLYRDIWEKTMGPLFNYDN